MRRRVFLEVLAVLAAIGLAHGSARAQVDRPALAPSWAPECPPRIVEIIVHPSDMRTGIRDPGHVLLGMNDRFGNPFLTDRLPERSYYADEAAFFEGCKRGDRFPGQIGRNHIDTFDILDHALAGGKAPGCSQRVYRVRVAVSAEEYERLLANQERYAGLRQFWIPSGKVPTAECGNCAQYVKGLLTDSGIDCQLDPSGKMSIINQWAAQNGRPFGKLDLFWYRHPRLAGCARGSLPLIPIIGDQTGGRLGQWGVESVTGDETAGIVIGRPGGTLLTSAGLESLILRQGLGTSLRSNVYALPMVIITTDMEARQRCHDRYMDAWKNYGAAFAKAESIQAAPEPDFWDDCAYPFEYAWWNVKIFMKWDIGDYGAPGTCLPRYGASSNGSGTVTQASAQSQCASFTKCSTPGSTAGCPSGQTCVACPVCGNHCWGSAPPSSFTPTSGAPSGSQSCMPPATVQPDGTCRSP